MAMVVAAWIVRLVGLYAALGLCVAVLFVTRGVGRIDPVARAGTWGFRLIIVPGVVALWPYLLWRWCSGATTPPVECNAHRRTAGGAP